MKSVMITLGVDTADAIGGAALWDDGGLRDERLMDEPLQHAERLLPLVDGMLERCSLSREAIGRIAVNRGPGSFTGLRIGLAAAKGLCQALGVPLVGIDAMTAYRARVDHAGRVCVVLQDRRDRFYVQRFSGERPMAAIRVQTRDELLGRLASIRSKELIIGNALPLLRGPLQALAIRTDGLLEVGADANALPSPATIARLGHEAPMQDALYALEPMYVEPLLAGSTGSDA
jgi:tRNA threonylcarbamoyladenosine biosynthesis protein TsaB